MFISSSSLIKIHKWPNSSSESDLEYSPHSETGIKQLSLCNDNSYLAYLQENGKAQIISLKNEANIHLVHTITSVKNITAICFKRFTKRNLAIGTAQGEVLMYDTKLRSEIRRLSKLPCAASLIQFSNDDHQIGVCCENSVVIYNNSETNLNDEFEQTSSCTAMRFHPNIPNQFAVGCIDGVAALWDINNCMKVLNFHEHSARVSGISLCKACNVLVTTGRDHKICILDVNGGSTEYRINLHQPVTSVDVSRDDKFIAAGLEDGSIYVYDLRKPVVPLHNTKPHNSQVSNIVFENVVRDSFIDGLEMASNVSTVPVDYKDNTEYSVVQSEPHCNTNKMVPKDHCTKEQILEKVKTELFKTIKGEMDDLENQLDEHCLKFEAFLSNEFDIIQNVIREKWDIFNISEANKSPRDAMSTLQD